MQNIICALRTMCESESGFVDLFNKNKSLAKLMTLTNDQKDIILFSKLFYGKARANLIALINDAYQYQKYAELILADLVSDGLSYADARAALDIFFITFGFPGYRGVTFNAILEFVSYDSGDFKTVYEGETVDGKEYGVGKRQNYYEGESCGFDECVWVAGRMIGYCYALEIEMGEYETKKYGFIVNDNFVGKYMTIYEDGEEGYMKGKPFVVE